MVSCQRTRVTDAVRRASMDSMIPDRATAALRTSALPIMMMMSSLNTEKACFAGTVTARIENRNARIATRSERKSVGEGKSGAESVALGGRGIIQNYKNRNKL